MKPSHLSAYRMLLTVAIAVSASAVSAKDYGAALANLLAYGETVKPADRYVTVHGLQSHDRSLLSTPLTGNAWLRAETDAGATVVTGAARRLLVVKPGTHPENRPHYQMAAYGYYGGQGQIIPENKIASAYSPADVDADADAVVAALAKLPTSTGESDAFEHRFVGNRSRSEELARALIFAAQLHGSGRRDVANEMAGLALAAASAPNEVLAAALRQIADDQYGALLMNFAKNGDWAALDAGCDALSAKLGSRWPADEALAARLKRVKQRATEPFEPPADELTRRILVEPSIVPTHNDNWLLPGPQATPALTSVTQAVMAQGVKALPIISKLLKREGLTAQLGYRQGDDQPALAPLTTREWALALATPILRGSNPVSRSQSGLSDPIQAAVEIDALYHDLKNASPTQLLAYFLYRSDDPWQPVVGAEVTSDSGEPLAVDENGFVRHDGGYPVQQITVRFTPSPRQRRITGISYECQGLIGPRCWDLSVFREAADGTELPFVVNEKPQARTHRYHAQGAWHDLFVYSIQDPPTFGEGEQLVMRMTLSTARLTHTTGFWISTIDNPQLDRRVGLRHRQTYNAPLQRVLQAPAPVLAELAPVIETFFLTKAESEAESEGGTTRYLVNQYVSRRGQAAADFVERYGKLRPKEILDEEGAQHTGILPSDLQVHLDPRPLPELIQSIAEGDDAERSTAYAAAYQQLAQTQPADRQELLLGAAAKAKTPEATAYLLGLLYSRDPNAAPPPPLSQFAAQWKKLLDDARKLEGETTVAAAAATLIETTYGSEKDPAFLEHTEILIARARARLAGTPEQDLPAFPSADNVPAARADALRALLADTPDLTAAVSNLSADEEKWLQRELQTNAVLKRRFRARCAVIDRIEVDDSLRAVLEPLKGTALTSAALAQIVRALQQRPTNQPGITLTVAGSGGSDGLVIQTQPQQQNQHAFSVRHRYGHYAHPPPPTTATLSCTLSWQERFASATWNQNFAGNFRLDPQSGDTAQFQAALSVLDNNEVDFENGFSAWFSLSPSGVK